VLNCYYKVLKDKPVLMCKAHDTLTDKVDGCVVQIKAVLNCYYKVLKDEPVLMC